MILSLHYEEAALSNRDDMALGKGPDSSPLATYGISIELGARFPRFRSSLTLRVSITLDNILNLSVPFH